jgi:hypothetical protein
MNAIKRNRLLVVLAAMLVLGSFSVEAQTGRLELNVPNFDLFTPTDWIDAATFTLKESIPAGISGTIITSQPMEVFLRGTVYKQATGDPGPLELASFYIIRRTPIRTVSPTGTGEARYEMTVGALSRGTEFDVSYTEIKSEVDKLKDQLKTGIASMTGRFTLDIALMAGDPVTGTQLDRIVRVFDIPFSTATQAKIIVQVDPVVTVPNPTFTVMLPAERPQLEYELAVYRVEDNPRDAVQNGRPVWRERVTDGRTILNYPQTATPLVQGARYVAAGKSFIQASSNRDKVSVDADLVVFRYGEASGSSGGTGSNTGGQDPNRPDPLITVFGNAATQVPPQLAQQLTSLLRRLEDRGWTYTQIRLNNRVISVSELAQVIGRFQNATVSVVE